MVHVSPVWIFRDSSMPVNFLLMIMVVALHPKKRLVPMWRGERTFFHNFGAAGTFKALKHPNTKLFPYL